MRGMRQAVQRRARRENVFADMCEREPQAVRQRLHERAPHSRAAEKVRGLRHKIQGNEMHQNLLAEVRARAKETHSHRSDAPLAGKA